MRILLDHGVPLPIRRHLAPHNAVPAKVMGWQKLSNGNLIRAGEDNGFDLLLTSSDKNMRYQQNHGSRKIAIVVIGNAQWPVLQNHVRLVLDAINASRPSDYIEVETP